MDRIMSWITKSGDVRVVAGMRGILLPGYLVRSIIPSALLPPAPTPALPRCGKGGRITFLLFHPTPTLTSNLSRSRSRKKEQEWE